MSTGPQNEGIPPTVIDYGTPPTTQQQQQAAASSSPSVDEGYEIVSSSTDVRLISPTETETVVRILARATSSGIVYPTYIEPQFYSAANTPSILHYWAGQVNTIAALPHVAAVWTSQDVNAANQLVDTMTIVAESSSGRSTTEITEPYYLLANESIAKQKVNAAVATMDAVEAG